MKRKFIERGFLFLFGLTILFYSWQAAAQSNNEIIPLRIDSLLQDEFFERSQIAIDVYNLTTKEPIYRKNQKLLLRPASNLKILTTAASYLFLNDFSFKTSVQLAGEIEDSTCTGNLYFIGGLDPDFRSDELDSLTREIKKFGINKITGGIYTDTSSMDSLFWGEGWMWDDDPALYAAYLSPLNINDNGIQIVCSPGLPGKPAVVKAIPEAGFLEITNSSVTVDTGKTNLNVTRDWLNRSNKIIIKGRIAAGSNPDTFSINLFRPANYFRQLLSESLKKTGISFSGEIKNGKAPEEAEEIFRFERPIDSVIINTNKWSDNLSAEMLLRALAFNHYGSPANAANGIKMIDSLISLVGFDPKNFRIVDGSGLSFYNLVSAELINSVLIYIYNEEPELFVKLYNSFPIAGYDGTLAERMREGNAFRKVRAKTGTISGASNLAGYMTNRQNNLIAFTILIQNYTDSHSKARLIQDKICEIIYNSR